MPASQQLVYVGSSKRASGADAVTNQKDELARANEAMYKQNLELTIRNKTLSALRKLSTIGTTALGVSEVTQRIVDTIVTELRFATVLISLVDTKNNTLRFAAVNQTESVIAAFELLRKTNETATVSLDNRGNLLVDAILDRERKITGNLLDIVTPLATQEVADRMENIIRIKTIVIYPLFLGTKALGTLSLGLSKRVDDLSRGERNTIDELIDAVAITINRAQLVEDIRRANDDLQSANERLKDLDKLKDEFVSLASHELRTPLTAIRSYIWMALSGKGGALTEKLKYYLDRAFSSTNRLIKLVNDMLNISRIESGRVSVQLARNKLSTLVDEVIGEIKPKIEEEGLTLSVDIAPGTEDVVADGDKIKEVLINFIGNALKFTPRGGTIRIHANQKDEMVMVSVIDSGEGMRPEDIGKLFQKFSTLQPSTTADPMTYQSSGLGLYISKSIISMHGGQVSAMSEGLGKGSTFTFTLHRYSDDLLAALQEKYPTEGLGIIHNAFNA